MMMSKYKHISAAALLAAAATLSTPVLSDALNSISSSAKLKAGSVVGKHIFGLARDFQGDPLLVADEPLIYENSTSEIGLEVGESGFLISLFDHSMAGVYVSDLDKDEGTALDTKFLDLGKQGGAHGAGAVQRTAWNTLLFSEDRLVNAKASEFDALVEDIKYYFKGKDELVNPYHYGWINEVIILDEQGSAKAIKNYAAGRTFASHLLAMPDGKTFYLFDTKNSGNAYVFIADEANSFAKGTLYAISGERDLAAVELGKSSALKMKFKLKKATFEKVFKQDDLVNGRCKSGFKLVESVFGTECLNLQKKNRKYAGQFEPIRMAAMKGVKPLVLGASGFSFDSHNNVIKITHNSGETRQYSLAESPELGTQYFMTN